MFTEKQIQNFLYEVNAEELNDWQIDSLAEKIVKNQNILFDLIEANQKEEEREAVEQGEWDSRYACASDDYPTYEESVRMTLAERDVEDKFDHIEEKNRDYCLGEQESQIRNDSIHGADCP